MASTSMVCPHCIKALKTSKPPAIGSRVRCPHCRGEFAYSPPADLVATASVAEPAAAVDVPVRSARRPLLIIAAIAAVALVFAAGFYLGGGDSSSPGSKTQAGRLQTPIQMLDEMPDEQHPQPGPDGQPQRDAANAWIRDNVAGKTVAVDLYVSDVEIQDLGDGTFSANPIVTIDPAQDDPYSLSEGLWGGDFEFAGTKSYLVYWTENPLWTGLSEADVTAANQLKGKTHAFECVTSDVEFGDGEDEGSLKLDVTFASIKPPWTAAPASSDVPADQLLVENDTNEEADDPSASDDTEMTDVADEESTGERGKRIASVGPTGVLQSPDAGSILDAAWTPDGRYLISFDNAGTGMLWDVKKRTGIDISPYNEGPGAAGDFRAHLRHAAVSPDGKIGVVGTSWAVGVIDIPSGKLRWETGDAFNFGPLIVDPAVTHVAVLVSDPADPNSEFVTVRNLATGREIFRTPSISPDDCALSPQAKVLAVKATKEFKQTILLFDVAAKKEVSALTTENARGLSFSPDGKTLQLTTGGKDDVQTFDVTQPNRLKLVKTVPQAQNGVVGKLLSEYKATSVSANGRTVATWAPGGNVRQSGNTIEILDAASGKAITVINSFEEGDLFRAQITCVALNAQATQAAVGTADGTIVVRNVGAVAEIPALATMQFVIPEYFDRGYHGIFKSPLDKAWFSPDEKWLITGGRVTTVWDLKKKRQHMVVTINDDRDEMANVPEGWEEGKVYAASSGPLAGGLWDVSGVTKMMGPELPYPGIVSGWMLQKNGKTLTTATMSNILHYGLDDSIHRGDFNDPACGGIRSSPDGRVAAAWVVPRTGKVGHADSKATELVILDAATGKVKKSLGKFLQPYNTSLSYVGWANHNTFFKLSFTPDGSLLAAEVNAREGNADVSRIRIWNWETGEEIPTTATTPVQHLEFVDGGRMLVTLQRTLVENRSDGQMATFFDVATGTQRYELELTRGHAATLTSWAFAPVGKYFATGDEQGVLLIRDLVTGDEVVRIQAHQAPLNAVGFSSNGNLIATCSGDGEVKIWRRDNIIGGKSRGR